jgi:hypothetical protein
MQNGGHVVDLCDPVEPVALVRPRGVVSLALQGNV